MKLAALLLLGAGLFAADATGRWSGSLIVKDSDGERSLPALLVLKQADGVLTGSGGPPDDQSEIQNGKVDGEVITFELSREDVVMRFRLKWKDDEMEGDVTRERSGETERARVVVKREKEGG